MGRRPEPDDLGPEADEPVVAVGGLVVEGDVNGHEKGFGEFRRMRTVLSKSRAATAECRETKT